jgi:cation:H+ antiporter
MIIDATWFLAGLSALVLGAELLVRGASRMAVRFGVSPLVIGLTVVAFGTSAPETAVSVGAVIAGQTDIAIGAVVGSNIFNILAVLGVSALVAPLVVHAQVIRQEIPILIGASVLLAILAIDGEVGLTDSVLLFSLVLAYTAFLIVQSRKETQQTADEYAQAVTPAHRAGTRDWEALWPVQVLLIAVGLAMLVVGSGWLVDAAVGLARRFGVSEVVIGLTIVAAGTSMPEVATSLMAVIRGQRDMAVGNAVGSCTFNILACVGLAGMVAPVGLGVPSSVLGFDLWVMLAVAVACLPVFVTGHAIERWEGGLFVAYYIAYATYLILAAKDHAALEAYSTTMLSFVIPLTVVTLVVVLLRPRARP